MKRPLSVVGRDQDALVALLSIHARPNPRILDVTYNEGRMWRGLPYAVHRSDRDPDLHARGFTDTVADFRNLPFLPSSFDVIVFDPPHITDAGDMGTGYAADYGLHGADLRAENVSHLFAPFLIQARRVLAPRHGIVLAKIADQIHGGVYQWQHVDLIIAAREAGFTPCDGQLPVQWARGGLIDPKWKRVCHVRQVHTFWIVLRNGPDCISPTAPVVDVKPRTGEMFAPVSA